MKKLFASLALISTICLCVSAIAQEQAPPPAPAAPPVPAYHTSPPAKGETLPPILTQRQLVDQGLIEPARIESYKAAALIPEVFYQMPCFCYCDRGHGHTSLHSCFESTHGANCGTCMAEALYTYQMTKKGWTPQRVREGILHGEYKTINLAHPDPVL